MARPPDERPQPPWLFHRFSDAGEAWDRWYVYGDPGLVIPIPGPPGATPAIRAAEYRRIFARLEAKRRQYRKYCLGKDAHQLWGRRWSRGERLGKRFTLKEIRKYLKEKTVSMHLKKPGDEEISASETGQAIREWPKYKDFCRPDAVTGNSHSTNYSGTKPRSDQN